MSNEDWTIAAAAGQIVAAVAAVIGLFFVGFQVKVARKTADLQALQEFVRSAMEREACLINADAEQKKQQAFFEFLNFMEMNAAAINGDLFHNKTRSLAVEKLCTSIVVIQANPAFHDHFCQAVTNSTTFDELGKFMKRERKTITVLDMEFRAKISRDM